MAPARELILKWIELSLVARQITLYRLGWLGLADMHRRCASDTIIVFRETGRPESLLLGSRWLDSDTPDISFRIGRL